MHKSLSLFGAALCVVLAASGSLAAPALEIIVVNASRLGASDQRATILTDADLEIRHAYDASDALRGLPGVALSQAGNRGGLTQVRIRGAEANHVMVMLDGIELNNPALSNEYNFGHLDLTGARRIELMNGPQSAIWGSDALAGLIFIDTTPLADSVRFDIAGGSHATRDASATAARLGEAGHVSVTASHFATAGTNIARSGNEEDAYKNTTLHLNARYNMGPVSIGAVLRSVEAHVEFDPAPFPNFVPTDGDRVTDTQHRFAKLEADFLELGLWQPQLRLTAVRAHDENSADGVMTDSTLGEQTTITLSNNFQFGESHYLSATVEHERQRFKQRGTPSFFGDPNQSQRVTTKSAAVEYQFRTGAMIASASARYDTNDDFDDATSYRAGIAYAIGPGRVFASVGTGIKNPTFTERFGYTPDTFIGNPDLEPEESFEYEAGYATERFSITYFDNTLDHEIAGFVFDPATGGFTARNLGRKSKRRGVELTYRDDIGPVTITAYYTYLDATEAARDEVRRPRHTGRIDLFGYLSQSLRFNLGLNVVGEQLDDDFSTFPATRRTLDDYTLVHGGLDLALSARTRLYVQLENAFDAEYQDIFGYRNPGMRITAGLTIDL